MTPPRKFDYERARRLHELQGWSYEKIARYLGVSRFSVLMACNEEARRKQYARKKRAKER